MKDIHRRLWDNYDTFAVNRGALVLDVLQAYMCVRGSKILDFGCGSGGIALQMARAGAIVTAVDIDETKLEILKTAARRERLSVQIEKTIPEVEYDAVLMVDVIEHITDPQICMQQIINVLKPGGYIYLSTPNKYAFLNLLNDPHFSLPLVAVMGRDQVRKLIAGLLHWQPANRTDFPQLLSCVQLKRLLQKTGLHWVWVNKQVADYAFRHPQSLWNRPWHLKIIKWITRKLNRQALLKFVSDQNGIFNKWINPAWFVLAEKSPYNHSSRSGLP